MFLIIEWQLFCLIFRLTRKKNFFWHPHVTSFIKLSEIFRIFFLIDSCLLCWLKTTILKLCKNLTLVRFWADSDLISISSHFYFSQWMVRSKLQEKRCCGSVYLGWCLEQKSQRFISHCQIEPVRAHGRCPGLCLQPRTTAVLLAELPRSRINFVQVVTVEFSKENVRLLSLIGLLFILMAVILTA